MTACVLIPALNPSSRLIGLLDALEQDARVARVILVNDGSSAGYASTFDEARTHSKVEFHAHETNLGKGAALRTGIQHYLQAPESARGVLVTADADGQHLPEDILAVAAQGALKPEALVLGTRGFGAAVPLRSRFGNDLTRVLFRAFTGRRIGDTQTGLRAIPAAMMSALLALKTDRYEFELEMLLLAVKKRIPFECVGIQTVYLNGNSDSHFRPLIDSIRIYSVLASYAPGSLLRRLSPAR